MTKPNPFLEKQEMLRQAMLDAGMNMGFQKCWDLIQICLRDPEAVGKDTFGKERIKRLYNSLKKYERDLGKAWLPTKEKDADVKQRDLDALLKEIWGDGLCPFNERYPYVKNPDYTKGRKEWK